MVLVLTHPDTLLLGCRCCCGIFVMVSLCVCCLCSSSGIVRIPGRVGHSSVLVCTRLQARLAEHSPAGSGKQDTQAVAGVGSSLHLDVSATQNEWRFAHAGAAKGSGGCKGEWGLQRGVGAAKGSGGFGRGRDLESRQASWLTQPPLLTQGGPDRQTSRQRVQGKLSTPSTANMPCQALQLNFCAVKLRPFPSSRHKRAHHHLQN